MLPPTVLFEHGRIVTLPSVFSFDDRFATDVMLSVSTAALMLTCTFLVGWIRDRMMRVEDEARLHTWHLRQLVPENVRPALASVSLPPADAHCTVSLRPGGAP